MDEENAPSGELIRRMASDDRAALGELYERYRGQVYGLALAVLKNRSDAEDVMQSAFVRVWDKAGAYREGDDAGAWIMTVTRNLALDRLRGRKAMTDIADMAETLPGGDDLSPALDRLLLDHLLTALDRLLLDHLLTALDCTERQIVMLHAVGGYTHREIARIVGKPCATVRWKYGSAVKKLQVFLEKEDSHEKEKQVRCAENR